MDPNLLLFPRYHKLLLKKHRRSLMSCWHSWYIFIYSWHIMIKVNFISFDRKEINCIDRNIKVEDLKEVKGIALIPKFFETIFWLQHFYFKHNNFEDFYKILLYIYISPISFQCYNFWRNWSYIFKKMDFINICLNSMQTAATHNLLFILSVIQGQKWTRLIFKRWTLVI